MKKKKRSSSSPKPKPKPLAPPLEATDVSDREAAERGRRKSKDLRADSAISLKTDDGATDRNSARKSSVERDWRTFILGAAVTVAAFILYCSTAAHDVITGDTPTSS